MNIIPLFLILHFYTFTLLHFYTFMYLVYYKNTRLYLKENEPYILHISKLNRTFDCVSLGTL